MSELGNYNAQAELYQALKNDIQLFNLVKGGFFNKVAEQDADFPRLVYTQLDDSNTKFADDKEIEATVRVQMSIFNTSETVTKETQIYKEIDRFMKSLGYSRYDYQQLYESDTGIHHLVLRYEKQFNGGNE